MERIVPAGDGPYPTPPGVLADRSATIAFTEVFERVALSSVGLPAPSRTCGPTCAGFDGELDEFLVGWRAARSASLS